MFHLTQEKKVTQGNYNQATAAQRFFYPETIKQPIGCRRSLFLQKAKEAADGWVELLRLPLSKEHAEALLTIDGGELVNYKELPRLAPPQLDYRRIYSLGLFVILALLPLRRWRDSRPVDGE